MLEVVIDTNVLMSGMIWSGVPGKVLEAWAIEKFDVALSMDIINEYTRVAKLLGKKAPKMNLVLEINKFITISEIPVYRNQLITDGK